MYVVRSMATSLWPTFPSDNTDSHTYNCVMEERACILAVETATEACSAALYINGEVNEEFKIAPREHAAILLPMIDRLMASAGIGLQQLEAIAFGRGPGSFTGLRIASSVTQGLAWSADLPVIPVSTLAAVAQAIVRLHARAQVLVALDARMQEVYWGAYRAGQDQLVQLNGGEAVCPPEAVSVPQGHDWVAAGDGWQACGDQLSQRCKAIVSEHFPGQRPQAQDVACLAAAALARGEVLPPEQAQPVYLRDNVARKPKSPTPVKP